MDKTKLLLLISIILLLTFNKTEAQLPEENKESLSLGASFGIGYVNPKKINDRIYDRFRDRANIHISWNLEINAGYFVTEEIEVKGALIGAVAFSIVEGKDMIGMTNTHYNTLTRLAPEILGIYHVPLNYYNSVYAGGGISYNKLAFSYATGNENGTSDSMPGLLLNVGLLTQKQTKQNYIELKVNFIKDKYDYLSFSGVTLNYGIRF